MNRKRATRWSCGIATGLFAVQFYPVRELLASLILFSAFFVALGLVVLILLLVHDAGRRGFYWLHAQAGRAAGWLPGARWFIRDFTVCRRSS